MPQQAWLSTQLNTLLIAPWAPVRVNLTGTGGAFPSPYNANAYDYVIADTSVGSVIINLPQMPGMGTTVVVKHDENTSLASNTVTVNGPTGPSVNISQPTPNGGTFGSSYQFPPAGTPSGNKELFRGTKLAWFNGGSAGGLLLDSSP